MIVCSCNVISDHDVREIVNAADEALRHAKQV
ncbi:MAG: (2Fe-2S)-binding protein, partial [Bradyrhizobium sp.]